MTDFMAILVGIPCWAWFLTASMAATVASGATRAMLLLGAPILGLLSVLATPFGNYLPFELYGLNLYAYRLDELSYPFLLAFNMAALIGGLYALRIEDKLQSAGALLYAASTMAVAGAGDLLSLIVAWEIMGISSAALIFARREAAATAAGLRYLMFQLGSGFLLICGAVGVVQLTGDARFDYIGINHSSGMLIFLAFGIKCGFPFLHNWISDGYPAATTSGIVFLSAFTTKAAIYAMTRAFPGTESLLYIGLAMAVLPMFYAIVEDDLRKVLAYSIISQMGFMLCGVATGLALGVNGAVAHAMNDIFFKGLLFMAIGVALQATGSSCRSGLGGLYRAMPITTTLCIIAAASISAVPFFSGYVSKTLIMDAVLQNGNVWVWYGLLLAAAGAPLYVGIKVPYFAFFAKPAKPTQAGGDPPWPLLAAMTLAATLCLLAGFLPQQLYALLPYSMEYDPYSGSHLLAQVQLLMFSALAFIWLQQRGLYPHSKAATMMDSDWFYRRLAPHLALSLAAGYNKMQNHIINLGGTTANKLRQLAPPHWLLPHWRPTGNNRAVALAVALLLLTALYLLPR
ncbi:MAG: Na(+)/H(+) antiporter subunit D [Candidatus Porifericomitaceae bacterium WSBS_2022_MAG_OTU9]